jgi:periplasmic protein CpxP/Spy
MTHRLIVAGRLLVTAGMVFAVALAAQAQPAPDYFDGLLADWVPQRGHGGPTPPPGRGGDAAWPDPRFAGADAAPPAPPMLRGVPLTEAQQDQVFAILHAQAPAVRERENAARRAQDDLRALAASSQYDRAKARALADAGARAQGELALLRADGEHQLFLLLTNEQRERLEYRQHSVRRP